MQNSFTHLQLHTEYSFFEGVIKIKELAKEIKAHKMKAVAITDYGNMFGAIEFYNTMKKKGIKPIIGLEIYVYDEKSNSKNLLCLYAKDYTGYKNLMYLSSMSFSQKFDKYPKINKSLLFQKSKGLICIDTYLQNDKFDLNKDKTLEYKKVFGNDFYIGIIKYDCNHINLAFSTLSKELDIKIVALNNTSFLKQEDANICKIFSDAATHKLQRSKYFKKEFYLKSSQEIAKLYNDIPQAIVNTQEIVDKCNLELKPNNLTPLKYKFTTTIAKEKNITLPKPNKKYSLANDAVLFEYECNEGLKDRLKQIPKEKHQLYWDRLKYEMQIIKNMKFLGYMLMVWDYVKYAKSKNIPVSHGRGSVVGSLVSYALKITDIDPIFYGLLFEIFLNPEIESVIDIDINFFQSKRDEIVDYIVKKYGKENVAKLIAFEKLSAKETIKNITKALNISPIKTNKIIKLIPNKPTITLKTAYKKEPKIKKELQNDLQLKRVWDYAIKLEGLTKGIGFNTSGLVISNKSLLKQAPLLQLNKQKIPIIQYNNQYIKYVNLIKFDLIKFNILDKIEKILKLIEKNHQQKIDFSTISLNDKKVFETISSGKTMGMFLIKNYGIQYLIKNFIKPSNFEDLSAILALYRIGPMECGMLDDFIERKYGRADIDYFFDEFEKPLKPILESTYGTIIYQEQVIQILQTIGGFSLIKADIIRRALEKEQFDLIQKYKEEFIKGAQTQGYQYNNAAKLFKIIKDFAKYCFNKSHAVAYAIISYQTAYLKTYYPKEFISVIFKK